MKTFLSMTAIALSAALLCPANEDGTEDSDGEPATWEDVYQAINDQVVHPEAQELLWLMVADLQTFDDLDAVEEYNALMDFSMDLSWSLTEEAMILTYAERDAVYGSLHAVASTLAAGRTRWETVETKPREKCKKPRKAECETRDTSNCRIKIKQKLINGNWENVKPEDKRCETEARD